MHILNVMESLARIPDWGQVFLSFQTQNVLVPVVAYFILVLATASVFSFLSHQTPHEKKVSEKTKRNEQQQQQLELWANNAPNQRKTTRPRHTQNMDSNSNSNSNSIATLAQQQLQHRRLVQQAFTTINAALSLDEKDRDSRNTAAALELYQRGVKELQAALRLSLPSKAEMNLAESTNAKMMVTLEMAEARIRVLSHQLQPPAGISSRPPFNLNTSAKATPPSSSRVTSNSSSRAGSGSVQKSRSSKTSTGKLDTSMANRILDEVVVNGAPVTWDDIVGLESAKQALYEIVILPTLRPELFTGLRAPARGVLLFGPPGTGKTMLAKAVAHESKATFYSISASTLTSKFVGDGEKMVKTLFSLARQTQPSVIFIDEIDSIMSERSEGEHEASRRLKTEFLLQFDGLTTNAETDRLLMLGATNRPQELDEAALRRLVKRIYIPLPEPKTRAALILHLLKGQKHSLTEYDVNRVVRLTEGYSGSDITALAREASLGPIRALGDKLLSTPADQIRPISYTDFASASTIIRPSLSSGSLDGYVKWNREYGTTGS